MNMAKIVGELYNLAQFWHCAVDLPATNDFFQSWSDLALQTLQKDSHSDYA